MELWAILPELVIAGLVLALVPLAGWVRGTWRRAPAALAVLGLAAAMVLTARMLPWAPVAVFEGSYAVDGFAHVVKLILLAGALLTVLLVADYFKGHAQLAHAPVAILFATLGGMGLVSSLDLGMIVLFLQMLSFASYLLVGLVRDDRLANEATLKMFLYGAAALAIMAYGLSFLYGLAGSLDLRAIGSVLAGADRLWAIFALGLVLVGFGFEMTVVPFHFWAPDVYQGTTAPVAGFLSVVPKVAAFAGALRFLVVAYGGEAASWPWWRAGLAAVTMSLGNLVALRQTRLKRLLAYSSIAQAGYVLMAIAVAGRSAGAIHAAGYYLAAYLFMNFGAFAVVAQVERAQGADPVSAVQGLARRAPWPAAVLSLSLLSLAGIPPLAGFMAKVLVLSAAVDGGLAWLAAVAAVNLVVGLYYYVAVIAQLFFRPQARAWPPVGGAGYHATLALCLAGTLVLGVLPGPVLPLTGALAVLLGG